MSETKVPQEDEIDLIELFQTVWDGKWIIISFVIASVVGVFGYQLTQPTPNFTATTEIMPITTSDAERYRASNGLGFFEVTRSQLLNLYIEQLEERSLFEEAIRTFELVEADNYENEQFFNEAVVALASSIEFLPPLNANEAKKGDVRRFWTVVFKYNDADKWKNVLTSVDSNATEAVRSTLLRFFATSLSVARQNRDFELEDINTLMANALADYETKAANKLAFLREQAEIARKLGVAKSTIEAQTFSAQNGMVANIKTDTPFYLRGYEAIEKEVELIESRENTHAFIDGLLELEQKKREIEQNRTLERAESLFNSTPIMSSTDFSAVAVTVEATDFETQNKQTLILALAIVLGGMLGVMYVLTSSAIKHRKKQ